VVRKTLELTAQRKNGEEFPIELSVSPLKLDGNWHAVGILRDITERKQAQEQLTRVNKELESFVSAVSHDLRSPLQTVEGFASVLRSDFGSVLGEIGLQHLDNITTASQNMAQTIDSLLSLRPKNRAELLLVAGIGEAKARRFGKKILAMLRTLDD